MTPSAALVFSSLASRQQYQRYNVAKKQQPFFGRELPVHQSSLLKSIYESLRRDHEHGSLIALDQRREGRFIRPLPLTVLINPHSIERDFLLEQTDDDRLQF